MSVAGDSIAYMRKDGRPLVTEFPIDPRDYITIVPGGEEPEMRADAIACRIGERVDRTAWMDAGIDPDDEEMWVT